MLSSHSLNQPFVANANGTKASFVFLSKKEWSAATVRISKRNLVGLLTMLSMLLENGLSLQKSLESLAKDRACRKYKRMLTTLLSKVSSGETLSRSMAAFQRVFTPTMIHHIALAEASGTLVDSLTRIRKNLEESLELRRMLVQKLSYPALVIFAGTGLITFMLVSVVPQFETIYAESKVSLPWVTSVVTSFSRLMSQVVWLVPIVLIGAFLAWRSMRRNEKLSRKTDALLLKLPGVGPFFQDLSAIEYLRSALVLSEAGFVPLDALTQAAKSVPNRHAKFLLQEVALDIQRGYKISVAMRRCEYMFPSAVMQLIAVGEQTGGLTQALTGACNLVKSRLDTRIQAVLGVLEPALTISLATCVGWIVLAIYMPMFKMFDVLDY